MDRLFTGRCLSLVSGILCLALFAVLISGCGGGRARPVSRPQREEADEARRAREAYEAGRLDAALRLYQWALKTGRSVEDEEAIAVHLINVAVVLRELGRPDEAMMAVDEVLARDPIRFDGRWFWEAALAKAVLLQDLGRSSEASSWADRALVACRETGCEDLGRVYNRMASIAMDREDGVQALALATSGLEASRKQGDRAEEANAYRLLADLKGRTGEPLTARSLYEKALGLDKELGRGRKIALDLMGLGNACAGAGEHAEALRYFRRALSVAQALEDEKLSGTARERIRALEAK